MRDVPGLFCMNYIQVPVPVVEAAHQIVKRVVGFKIGVLHGNFLSIFYFRALFQRGDGFFQPAVVAQLHFESLQQLMRIAIVERTGDRLYLKGFDEVSKVSGVGEAYCFISINLQVVRIRIDEFDVQTAIDVILFIILCLALHT